MYSLSINNILISNLMLDKLLGKKEKGIKIFTLPERKYCTDHKKVAKMDKKDLLDHAEDMEKYIKALTDKLEAGKKEYQTALEKIDEVNEKHAVLDGEMSRINNEHEELSVKFTNLQNSLELFTHQKEQTFQTEVQFCRAKNILPNDKVKDLQRILSVYHDQVILAEKISTQNKQLKQKYADLETEYYDLSDKFNAEKNIMTTNDAEVDQAPKQEQSKEEGEEANNSNEQISKLEEKLQQLKSAIEGKDQMIVAVNKQLSAERVKKEEVQQELKNMEDEIAQSFQTVSQLEEKIEMLNNDLKTALAQSAEDKATIKKLTNQLKDLEFEKGEQEESMNKFIKQIQILSYKIEELKKENKRIEEQKNVILETNNMQLTDAGSTLKEYLDEAAKLRQQLEQKKIELDNLNQKMASYQVEITRFSKSRDELEKKDRELKQMQLKINQGEERMLKAEQGSKVKEEEYLIKIKKLEFEFNSQKIKIESMKRSLSQLEVKDQESQQKLDEMYESKVRQEGKIVHLQKKLKEYKHLIQYLKKEKIQMEKTFENKLRNFEEMVVAEPEDEEDITPRDCKQKDPKFSTIEEGQEYEAQITILQNKMVDMEETLGIVKMEGHQIRTRVNELELQNSSLKNTIKVLNEKREQAKKQIKRLSSVKPLAPSKVSHQPASLVEDHKAREKRIAEKAYRGFDILSKQLHPIYKQFLGIHIGDIQKPEVKAVETGINMLVKKAMDMKDIFQDYL